MRANEYENTSAKVCIRLFLFSWFRCIYICLYVFSHFMVPMYARSVYALISQRSSWKVVVTGEIKWGCNRARAKRYVRRATRDQVLRLHINFQDQQNEGQLLVGAKLVYSNFTFTHILILYFNGWTKIDFFRWVFNIVAVVVLLWWHVVFFAML